MLRRHPFFFLLDFFGQVYFCQKSHHSAAVVCATAGAPFATPQVYEHPCSIGKRQACHANVGALDFGEATTCNSSAFCQMYIMPHQLLVVSAGTPFASRDGFFREWGGVIHCNRRKAANHNRHRSSHTELITCLPARISSFGYESSAGAYVPPCREVPPCVFLITLDITVDSPFSDCARFPAIIVTWRKSSLNKNDFSLNTFSPSPTEAVTSKFCGYMDGHLKGCIP
jgi:hypothetical protein